MSRTRTHDTPAPRPRTRPDVSIALEPAAQAPVVPLSTARATLAEQLLTQRAQTAIRATCYAAHHLSAARSQLRRLQQLEDTIERLDPALHRRSYPDWVVADAELMHDSDHPHPACPLCRAGQEAA